MATTKSWYPGRDEEYEPTDFGAQSNQASSGGDWKGGAASQFYGNYNGVMQGNPQANTYNKQTGWSMPNDYSSDVKATLATGGSPYYAIASNAMGDQKANGSVDLNQFAGQNDAAVADYYNANKFGYNDPYGFMNMALGMDGSIQNALSAYAGNTYQNYLASPEYKDLADLYLQNGQLAMENTLGTASQMSGGLDNSYAVAAAQQSYNDYMSNLQDAAQTAYKSQLANQAAQLSALQGQQQNYLNAYGDDWNRSFDAYTDDDDRMYKWAQFVQDNMVNNRDFAYKQMTDPLAAKNDVDYGNANLGYSYDSLDESARQADNTLAYQVDKAEKDRAFDYYSVSQQNARNDADNATKIATAQIGANSSGSSGGNVSAKDLASSYLAMADDAAKVYDTKKQNVLEQAAALALSGQTAKAQELVNSLFQ